MDWRGYAARAGRYSISTPDMYYAGFGCSLFSHAMCQRPEPLSTHDFELCNILSRAVHLVVSSWETLRAGARSIVEGFDRMF
jgi:hypothetical protein